MNWHLSYPRDGGGLACHCEIGRDHSNEEWSSVAFGGTPRAVPVPNDVSDGYHTFGELYAHRRALTAALCRALSLDAWRSRAHHPDNDPMFDGHFVVGIDLPSGTITYHYALERWNDFAHVTELPHAPHWDGAPPDETVRRLLAWARDDVPTRDEDT